MNALTSDFHHVPLGIDRTSFVDGFTNYVDDTTEGLWSNWDADWRPYVSADLAPNETFCAVHCNCTACVLSFKYIIKTTIKGCDTPYSSAGSAYLPLISLEPRGSYIKFVKLDSVMPHSC